MLLFPATDPSTASARNNVYLPGAGRNALEVICG